MNSSRKFPPIFMPLKVIYVRKTPGGGGGECRGLENEMGGCDIQSNYTMCVLLLKELMLPKTLSPCLRILEFLRAAIELYFLGILRILEIITVSGRIPKVHDE